MMPVSSDGGASITWHAHGLECVVVRTDVGTVNGYVCVPGITAEQAELVQVHGGVTFGPKGGWIGFDTMHYGDYWPDTVMGTKPVWYPHSVVKEWSLPKVRYETERMALSALSVVSRDTWSAQ